MRIYEWDRILLRAHCPGYTCKEIFRGTPEKIIVIFFSFTNVLFQFQF